MPSANSSDWFKRPYFWLALLTGILGFAVTAVTTFVLYNEETKQIRYQFEIDINKRSFELQKEMGLHFETLYRWKSFYETYQELPFDKFQKLASDVLKRHAGITALAWTQRVPHAARPMFEAKLREMDPRLGVILDLPDISEGFSKETRLRPAAKRDDYYPVMMIAPIDTSNFIMGLDVSGDPLRRRNFNIARDTGKIQATEVFPSFVGESGEPEFAAFVPVYKGEVLLEEQRRKSIQGFIVASFRLNELIRRSGFVAYLKGVELKLLDKNSNEGLTELHIHPSRSSSLMEEYAYDAVMEPMAGQQWSIHATPSKEYIDSRRSLFPMFIGGLGVISVLLAFLMIRMIDRRTKVIENTVKERTKALNEAKDKLERLSRTDGLTGVANRRFFDEFIEKEWRRAKRESSTLSLIMLDVDYFKKYNDHYGHVEGDACLQAVAKALSKSATRATDLVARYGGEEFAVIIQGSCEEALAVAEKARQAVADLEIEHKLSEVSDHVSISLGVSCATPSPAPEDEVDVLIKAADEALYKAKEGGRNRVENSCSVHAPAAE